MKDSVMSLFRWPTPMVVALSNAAIRPSVCLSVCLYVPCLFLNKNGAFNGYDYYRTRIGYSMRGRNGSGRNGYDAVTTLYTLARWLHH